MRVRAGRTTALRRAVAEHRHSSLLAAIVIAFAVRPVIGNTPLAAVAFSIALLLLLGISLYSIEIDELVGEREALLAQVRRQRILGWTLALAAIVERVLGAFWPVSLAAHIGTYGWLMFFAYVSAAKLRQLLQQRVVTGETISLAVAVYLLLGMTWGVLYVLMFQGRPEAFHFERAPDSTDVISGDLAALLPGFVYFSLTTLATVGYGDITPVTLPARYAAVAEGITGQFYLAVLVARLVAIQLSRRRES